MNAGYMAFNTFCLAVICFEFLFTITTYILNEMNNNNKASKVLFKSRYLFFPLMRKPVTKNDELINYLITHLNNFIFPLNGGYFTEGSNQVGVFITAFL